VLPFVVVLLLLRVDVTGTAYRILAAVYMLAGAGAISYSIYTSFNKQALAGMQAGGRYRAEYETFFFGRSLHDSSANVDTYVLHMLESCK
jgi:hypothetical protein